MTAPLVQARFEDGIALLTLDSPPVNGYSFEMMKQLDQHILDARFDDSIHVIVLTGAGDRFFCAGADIGMLGDVTPGFKYQFCLHANETLLRLEHTSKLVIAALNGHTVGGGFEVALACDLRIARKGGGKLGMPEVALGVLPGTGGTQRLARLVGKSKAIEMMIHGNNMSFEDAAEHGLVNRIEEADDFLGAVLEYARGFCPPNKAAMAVGHIKRSVQTGAEIPLESGLALERELQAKLFASEDAKAGIQAYLDKAKPEFRGR